MIDTDKYEELTMNDMEHLELWEFSRKLFAEVKRLREQNPNFIREQWADGHISAEELYEKLMTIRGFIDKTTEHALNWEEEVQQAEKEAEEAQQRREYGYVHPTVDDYDESLDDPNYEYEGDEE